MESADEFNEIQQKCAEAMTKLVPAKSSVRYEKQYVLFEDWRKLHKVEKVVNEDILLAYFLDASKKGNPSTLWSKYSMLKSMLMVKEAVDMSKYPKVTAFLKKQSVGHEPTKSKILTRDEVNQFMKESPTEEYLLLKVVAMMGIAGGCRREELYNMAVSDVQDTGTQLLVTIPFTKTNTRRVFTVINDCEGINVLNMYRKYISLRPKNYTEKALFINYRKGNCICQRVGIHTIGGVPKKIAEFLKLEHPERYTGHCFRRTSATLLANAGADLNVLKRHGGWKSSSVAEQYIEDSIENKKKVARMIQNGESFVQVLQNNDDTISSTVSTQ